MFESFKNSNLPKKYKTSAERAAMYKPKTPYILTEKDKIEKEKEEAAAKEFRRTRNERYRARKIVGKGFEGENEE